MLRTIRILLAALAFAGITLLFLDFTGATHAFLGWLAKIQLLPAILSVNVVVIVALLLLTIIFGRVYCSVICPLGVMQDIIAWLGRRGKKKNRYKYGYSKPKTWLRVVMLVIMVASIVCGISAITALLAPYSAYGRIASSFFAPIYALVNNLFAAIAAKADSYAFYPTEVWGKASAVVIVAAVTLVALAILAWRNGRTYCNTICPVGTVLGFLSKFSLFRPVIDTTKCNKCKLCEKSCKAACIDLDTHTVDYSRCVVCGNCLEECKFDALKFTSCSSPSSSNSQKTDEGRRAALTGVALLAGTALAKAQSKVEPKTTDGGLADIIKKKKPRRKKLITPPGSLSIRNLRSHCTACQLCIDACPNDVLRPSSSLDRFMQPEVSFEKGYCRPECNRCSQVCPTSAIQPVTVEQRTAIQVGHAVWTRELCIPVKDEKPCGLCARKCPAQAIQMVPLQAGVHQDGWRWKDADGQEIPREKVLLIPVVNEEKCIGCGACENLCPSSPISAIYVEGHEVHKEI